ncbi:MAG: hypothetical protein VKJ64_19020, partial [Leptolyngbyaceae bacterium]|nr:hypothetical protein [Leptolyngbyaceae bacterium]
MAGFVLPTTVLLLLVVSLAVSTITLRSYSRSQTVIGERSEQVIYNLATPALDRAKAKLEYLFQRDSRFPSGLPGEGILSDLLEKGVDILADVEDAYTFPDEVRIDLNEDNQLDSGWKYRVDINGDGTEDGTVAYSIILGTPTNPDDMIDSSDAAIQQRANALQVRHAPLSGAASLANACQLEGGNENGIPIEQGWFQDPMHSAILRKNFQVDVYVLPDNRNAAISTLEFHQDRQMTRGNKWAAWFRNDLEIFPGPLFNWNGAMHTEGNLVVGLEQFNGYLISSPFSCLYSRDAAEITVANVMENPEEDIPAFQGQFISGRVNSNSFGNTSSDKSHFHLFDTQPVTDGEDTLLDLDHDSVKNSGPKPGDYALDPIMLMTQDVSVSRNITNGDPAPHRDGDWKDLAFTEYGRLVNRSQDPPYVDDFYRADNRYGPKPRYQGKQIPGTIGEPITGDRLAAVTLDDITLTRNDTDDIIGLDSYGLDGYWERRARAEGLRLVASQRLELGNTFGWVENQDPLYPPNKCPSDRCHETLQRRTLRDNLAAVQSLAIYHQGNKSTDQGEFPIACYALTAHPGTAQTIKTSRTFANSRFGSGVDIDFLHGQGVNGWEFAPPTPSAADFAKAIAPTQPLGRALRNLAYFAGDPKGGSPSFPPFQDDAVHPYSYLNMWGDFSMLRRVLSMLDKKSYNQGNPYGDISSPDTAPTTTITYEDLSPADQATLHSAACTLGMLAYNMNLSIAEAEAAVTNAKGFLTSSGQKLAQLLDGTPNNGDINDIYLSQKFPGGDTNPYYDNTYSKAQDAYDAWVDPDPNTVIPDLEKPGQYICKPGDDNAGFDYDCDIGEYASQFSLDQFIAAFRLGLPAGQQSKAQELVDLTTALVSGYQVLRDRAMGFRLGNLPNLLDGSDGIKWDMTTGYTGATSLPGGEKPSLKTGCDPNMFSMLAGGGNGASDRDAIVLSVMVCGQQLDIKYPSLYYLFPIYAHNHLGTQPKAAEWSGGNVTEVSWDDQPLTDEYVADEYIFNPNPSQNGVNDQYVYSVLEDNNTDGIENGTDNGLTEIAIQPRSLNLSNWITPTATNGSNLIYDSSGNKLAAIPFLDKGIFNGREMMGVRVLDLDLAIIRTSDKNLGPNIDNTGTDHWFPDSGIIYAAREDAVREDNILRPRG